jgi:septum formation protein
MLPEKFVLASASPARKKLLETIGINPIVEHSNLDESSIELNDPLELVQTLAAKKAEIVASNHTNSLVLGCDSLLMVNGEIYGKPDSEAEAIARWQNMRGNMGLLYTGHTLIDQVQQQNLIRCGITKVYFAAIDDDTIKAYVDTGEPLKCAGCFALEGKGGLLVEKIEGCHSNVIGLSLPLLRQMLRELGYQVKNFWIEKK